MPYLVALHPVWFLKVLLDHRPSKWISLDDTKWHYTLWMFLKNIGCIKMS